MFGHTDSRPLVASDASYDMLGPKSGAMLNPTIGTNLELMAPHSPSAFACLSALVTPSRLLTSSNPADRLPFIYNIAQVSKYLGLIHAEAAQATQ
jgi:hypothetical protein